MANTGLYESDLEDGASAYNAATDDFGAESLTDAQSPVDGYFEQRELPQQMYAENPMEAHNRKAAEAAAEQTRAQRSTDISQPRPQRSTIEAPQTPIIDQAPPNYEAATAGQREQQRQAFGSDHPLVRNGLLHDHAVSGAQRAPQSMRDNPSAHPTSNRHASPRNDADLEEQPTESTGLLSGAQRGSPKNKRRCCSSRSVKTCLLTLVVILLAVMAIVTSINANKSRSRETGGGAERTFPNRSPPNDQTPPHRPTLGACTLNSYSATQAFNFTASGDDFALLEQIDARSFADKFPRGITLAGTVQISPALQAQEDDGPDVQVFVNIATTAPLVISRIMYEKIDGSLELRFPDVDLNGWRPRDRACFDIAVAIHVKKGAEINDWNIDTRNMEIIVDSGVFGDPEPDAGLSHARLNVTGNTLLRTVSGRVDANYWESRRTVIETTSGRITGTFALRDLLALKSISGSIDAQVEPKKADDAEPAPAEFVMKTSSGSLSADFRPGVDREIPEREYRTDVRTTSGNIEGSYILGKETQFSATSSSISIVVLPYTADVRHSSLYTDNTSGRTEIRLLEPYRSEFPDILGGQQEHRKGVIDSLQSRHRSISGSIHARYPQSWEGKADAKSTSGSVHFSGKDLVLDYVSDRPWTGHRVIGHKGTGTSELKFQTTSGSIEYRIGEADSGSMGPK